METPEQPEQPTPTATASSSPTAARVASGRAVPRPLDLSGSSTPTGSHETDEDRSTAEDAAEAGQWSGRPTANRTGKSAGAGSDDGRSTEAALTADDSSEIGITPTATGAASTSRDPRRYGNSSFPKRSPRSKPNLPSPNRLVNRISSFYPTAKTTKSAGLSYNPSTGPSPRRAASGGFNAGANKSAETTSTPGSRFLLTVVPPTHLPHDPPHPRANPQASGYGPPEHFRRGTLIPLYPTLSSQLAAIAREYGLPSSGGLVLYLLSTADPATQAPLPQAVAYSGDSGPRIGDHAWNMLWGQLLAEEEAERQDTLYGSRKDYDFGSENDSEDAEGLPPVPPIPTEHAELPLSRPESAGGLEETDYTDEAEESAPSSEHLSAPTDAPADRAGSTLAAQAALGRGMPASTPPNGKQARRVGSLPMLSQANGSRQSLRAGSSRGGGRSGLRGASSSYLYSSMPASAASSGRSNRSVSYSPSVFTSQGGPRSAPVLPTYGSSVVVGKVEFDVHSSSRQGKWYESWLASANPAPASQPASKTHDEPSSQLPASESRQELRLPSMLAHQMPGRRAGFIAQPFTFPRKRDSEVSRVASSDGGEAISTAAGHGHSGSTSTTADESGFGAEGRRDSISSRLLADSSIETPRPFHSRKPSSVVSRTESVISPDERLPAATHAETSGYAPLPDGDDNAAGAGDYLHARTASSQSRSTALGSVDEGPRYGVDQTNHRHLGDPLGDVFGSDETAWQGIASDDASPRHSVHDSVVSTGLGIAEAGRIAGFPTAPGVAEHTVVEALGARRSSSSLPPQDDIAEVAALLSPTTVGPPGGSALLASPIRLDSAKEAADETGVFASAADEKKRTSSFIPTHATRRSISTVNFTVRPPSTVASRSPDELSQRANRQGWSEVPATVDPTMSTSTSISSIAGLTEESVGGVSATASSIGLERNLNDLEQALAELSPARSFPSKINDLPFAPVAEGAVSPVAENVASTQPQLEAGELVADAKTAAEPASPQPNSLLGSRVPFRYGVSGGSPVTDTFVQRSSPVNEQPGLDVPEAGSSTLSVPTPNNGDTVEGSGRAPRSSSLRKPVATEPHLVALPPSPVPAAAATFSPVTEESQPSEVPAIPSASPSWPEPTALPFQSASPEKVEAVEPEPVPPVVENAQDADLAPPVPRDVPVVPTSVPPAPAEQAATPAAPTQASPGRSPGRLKKLRTGMWGSKSKTAESPKEQHAKAKLAVEPPKELVPEEASGAKSPGLGSFFGRFGKKQPRKSDPSTPAAETTDEEVPIPVAAETPSATDTEVDETPTSSHEEVERPQTPEDDDRVNVAGIGRVRTMSVASLRSPESPHLSLPPFPPSLARHISLASPQTGPKSSNNGTFAENLDEEELTRSKAVLSPMAAPFVPSAPSTPRPSHQSEDSQASTSPSAFPPPPHIGSSLTTSSRSAPVTPAGWSLATPRQRLRSKHRLSADIDQLLSQMHDIEFGLGDDDDAADAKEEMRNSVIKPAEPSVPSEDARAAPPPLERTTPTVNPGNMSPVSATGPTALAYQVVSGSVSPTSPALELSSPLDGAPDDAGERPSSADLLVLGSIMTQSLA
ncbi:hypothetical protein JCM3774_001448 [Rhodotorula dairenensis]